ncbi:unnamed protein product [Penicillium camemberti]|uniref:Str. FM013 n=1 Tax=Penicillium camemberti (strain FM 013) TaxID=1429867 RepID=A0A0G4P909_PENC3|nr:unnamed protein product [Penicillium camemberti]
MDSSQVLAKLFYLKNTSTWTREKPFTLFIDVSKVSGAQNSNIEKDPIDKIPIRDVRSCELSLELDQNGFEVMDLEQEGHTPMCFDEEDWIENEYLKFLCNKIKERLGAKEVRPYEYKKRYRHPGFGDTRLRGDDRFDPPIPQVHADMTSEYGKHFLEQNWPEAINSERLQVLNVWRPLINHITEWPLALCDYKSVDRDSDLISTDQVKPAKGPGTTDSTFAIVESYVSFHNPRHTWYYLKNQTFNEGWLFKIYDSKESAAQGPGEKPRRSIETRLMVAY